ncbi:MAG: helix-turn-helix domain-containing protein [Bacillota bacterium]|nr:helix-turn-helix domain-containing protein [Bacillota bacterium]
MSASEFQSTAGGWHPSGAERIDRHNVYRPAWPLDDSRQPGLFLASSGQRLYALPGHLSGPRAYDYYILHFIIGGRGTLYAPQGSYQLTAGDAFVIRPYTMNRYVADLSEPWTYYWIGFGGREAASILERIGIPAQAVVFRYEPDASFLSLLHAIAAVSRLSNVSEFEQLGRLYTLFARLAADSDYQQTLPPDDDSRLLFYLEQHYQDENLTIAEIARALNLSRSQLYRKVRRLSGYSVQQYLLHYRLNIAAAHLRNTSANVAEIALKCGFRDPAYFSRAFRLRYKLSPSEYRTQTNSSAAGYTDLNGGDSQNT